jgi:hypothetical protein
MYSMGERRQRGNKRRNRLVVIIAAESIISFGDIWFSMTVPPQSLSVMVRPLVHVVDMELTNSLRSIQESTWRHASSRNVGWGGR